MNSQIAWSDFNVFLAIAEEGSLSAASQRLRMSQPTVGRRLDALEDRLGADLFVRTARGLTLTETGVLILDNARRIQDEAMAIERIAEGRDTGLSGTVTISVVDGLGTDWLTPALLDFHNRYPDIVINMQIDARAADLVNREADIALRLFRPVQNTLIAKRCATIGFGLFASRDYLDRCGRPQTLEGLVDHDWVASESYLEERYMPGFHEVTSVPCGRVVYTSENPVALMAACRSGFGVGVLSCRWAARYKELERLFPDRIVGELGVWLVMHEDLKHSARMRAAFDFIAARLTQDARFFAEGTRAGDQDWLAPV